MKKLKSCIVALSILSSFSVMADDYDPTENWIEYSKSELSGKTLQCIERAESYERSYTLIFTDVLNEYHRPDVNYKLSDLLGFSVPGMIEQMEGIEHRKDLRYHYSALNSGKVSFDDTVAFQAMHDNNPKKVAKVITESIKYNCLDTAGIMYP